jgi:signal transduction histidine kinase
MPSPRTEADGSTAGRWARFDPYAPRSLVRRLNVRLVLAFSAVALVGLVVSGLAITQILPGYFREQTAQQARTSAASAALLLSQEVLRRGEIEPSTANVPELRDVYIVRPVANSAARIFNATVEIYNADNQQVAVAEPPDIPSLEELGLRRETDVDRVSVNVGVELPSGESTTYTVVISEPFSTRETTMSRISDALIGAGMLALLVSLVAGVIAARSITLPIGRLRRVAARVAQGQLDERAVPSGVVEVDELGQQFNVMADRLSGTLRMLEADRDRLREFVADVSHELRTPIAALKMYTELQRDGEVDEPTRSEFLERSSEQIARLEWLSTNLLDLSRIDAGIFPLDMRTGDLRDPVQAVVQALSEVAVERGVSLDSAVPAETVELRFDRERIVQLMTNLIGNALKFTPRGGAVTVRLEEEAEAVMLEIGDTGPGIPPDELPHIFERFYRGTNTGDARASGSGLGLAIVRSIVEMHGGEIDVASVLGQGTIFRIRLPQLPASAEHEAATKVNETSRGAHPARNPGPIA